MYIFDTMILSYLIRHDPLASLYRNELMSGAPIFVSCQTIGEIRYGSSKKNWGAQKIKKALRITNQFAILPIDETTASFYGDIRAEGDKLGRPLQSQDAWILATAKQYNLTLVSHDGDLGVGREMGVTVVKH